MDKQFAVFPFLTHQYSIDLKESPAAIPPSGYFKLCRSFSHKEKAGRQLLLLLIPPLHNHRIDHRLVSTTIIN